LVTIEEIEKVVWDKMQKAIVNKDAQAVAAFNAMALEISEIKVRISALAAKVAPHPANAVNAYPPVAAPPTVGLDGISRSRSFGVPNNYTGRPIRGYILNDKLVLVRTYKDLLISLSNGLRKKHGANFDQYALQLGGRKRRYFSRSQQDMKYAHKLDGGGLYAETNLNANLIVNNICIPLLRQLEPGSDFDIQGGDEEL
jgi:hypothetical protein